MDNVAETLMRRQPPAYRLDKLRHLGEEQLRRRVQDVIHLVRDAKLRADRETWDAITAW